MNESRFDGRAFADTLPARPGVYRMLDAAGTVLYVGKARNLKNRVTSYFQAGNVAPKVQALVQITQRMEITITGSETEALLLEYNLIKKHRPRFNVVLRDDKSFPWLHLDTRQEYPRLSMYRGSRKEPGRYFGPYPSAGAVRQTLQQLQKLFRLRNCEDSFFANRSRPCLQYQIQRCTAPCVGLISITDYAGDVEAAVKVLEGRNTEVNEELARRMEEASRKLEFEHAARIRDQLASLRAIQAQQAISSDERHDADIIALASSNSEHVVVLLFVRAGQSLGSATFFPSAAFVEPEELISGFLTQYYLEREAPAEIILAEPIVDRELLEATFSKHSGHKVRIASEVRGIRARWVQIAQTNATEHLRMRAQARSNLEEALEELRSTLGMTRSPRRIECFDISHTGGTDTVASCVVFGPEGAMKQEYRRFNITDIQRGDDFAAMHQALNRRYRRVKEGEVVAPDLLLIDGGAGQVKQAGQVLEDLGLSDILPVGVAKGADRKPGQERLFLLGRDLPIIMPPDSRALHLVQRVRDEAHRFAISGHRRKRARRYSQSILETIPGLGPVKRRELLKQFGGMQGILRAGMQDLSGVRGVGSELAKIIYEHLHPGS